MNPNLSTFLTLAQTDGAPTPPPSSLNGAAAPANGTTATADGQPLGDPNATGAPPDTFGGLFGPLLLGVMVLFFVMIFWGQHKDKKKKQQLLDSLGKGDKVQTAGGIIGTITDLKDTEITLKVDENTNTKMKFARSAVSTVLRDKSEED